MTRFSSIRVCEIYQFYYMIPKKLPQIFKNNNVEYKSNLNNTQTKTSIFYETLNNKKLISKRFSD